MANTTNWLAVVLVGVVFCYAELLRPGKVYLGAFGLLAILFGEAHLSKVGMLGAGLWFLGFSMLSFLIAFWRAPKILGAVGTALLIAGSRMLFSGSNQIGLVASLCLGLPFGLFTATLARVTIRARRAKWLNVERPGFEGTSSTEPPYTSAGVPL